VVRALILLVLGSASAFASDVLTVYELLAPSTHSFSIIYDMSTAVEGSPYLFNPIRNGSVASDERVIDAATGKPLKMEEVSAADAAKHGLRGKPSADSFIQVTLAQPVPKGGEARVRIFKIYMDAASYGGEAGELTFQRGLGIKRNVIVLPAGYELIACGAPGIITTQSDGRIRVSFTNDRDDELMVKLRGRLIK
jgi:hypothetical protein